MPILTSAISKVLLVPSMIDLDAERIILGERVPPKETVAERSGISAP